MKKVIEILQRYVDEIDRDIENYLGNSDFDTKEIQMTKLFLRAKRQGFVTAIKLIHSESGNNNEKELIYLHNRVDRLRNELSRKKAEIKRVTSENRRIKESNAQLIGEKMQLRKELNRYKARGWDYDVT